MLLDGARWLTVKVTEPTSLALTWSIVMTCLHSFSEVTVSVIPGVQMRTS